MPLYRQQDSFAQLGWSPSCSTLGQIVTNSAELFAVRLLFSERVLAAAVINTDDTPVTLLTRGKTGSRQARFWIYRSNDGAPQYDVFAFTDSRERDGPVHPCRTVPEPSVVIVTAAM